MRHEVTAPVSSFTGESAGASFQQGRAVVDDAAPAGRAQLAYFRTAGYGVAPVEAPAAEPKPDEGDLPFDPSQHNVDEVTAYLDSVADDEEETLRVLVAESEGKNRKTITERSAS